MSPAARTSSIGVRGRHLDQPLLTIPEIARHSRLDEKTVWRWIRSGSLPAIKLGSKWRVQPTDYAAFLAERVLKRS